MVDEILVGPLEARLIPARHDDAALETVAHDRFGHAAQKREGALMARDPVRALLRTGRFRVCIVGRAHRGDEELRLDAFASGGIDVGGLLARIVDKEFLAGAMDLPHRDATTLTPLAIELAELMV